MTTWNVLQENVKDYYIVSHISPKLYHIVTRKNIKDRWQALKEWIWKKYYVYEIPFDIIEKPIHYNIIAEMCNTGWAAHMVKWNGENYIVDLMSLSKYSHWDISTKKYSDKYGCCLILNEQLEPIELTRGNLTIKDPALMQNIFLPSLMLKTLLIDNVLANRFIFGDNLMVSVKKYSLSLHQDLKNFILPFTYNIIESNQYIYDYCMCPGGIFEGLIKEYLSYMTNEYDFCIWETPKEMLTNNIGDQTVTDRTVPLWYEDAITYWNVVDKFVYNWTEIFLNNTTLNELKIVEEWLTSFYGLILDVTDSLRELLTRLIWTATFFQQHVSLNRMYSIFPKEQGDIRELRESLIYHAEKTEKNKIQLIASLWKLQDAKYHAIWKEFEHVVESMEFKSLGLVGGELTCGF